MLVTGFIRRESFSPINAVALRRLDRCFLELMQDGEEAFLNFRRVVESANVIMATYADEALGDTQACAHLHTLHSVLSRCIEETACSSHTISCESTPSPPCFLSTHYMTLAGSTLVGDVTERGACNLSAQLRSYPDRRMRHCG